MFRRLACTSAFSLTRHDCGAFRKAIVQSCDRAQGTGVHARRVLGLCVHARGWGGVGAPTAPTAPAALYADVRALSTWMHRAHSLPYVLLPRYFGVYEYSKAVMSAGQDDGATAWQILCSGAAAGVIAWGAVYPMDTLKSMIQSTVGGEYSGVRCSTRTSATVHAAWCRYRILCSAKCAAVKERHSFKRACARVPASVCMAPLKRAYGSVRQHSMLIRVHWV